MNTNVILTLLILIIFSLKLSGQSGNDNLSGDEYFNLDEMNNNFYNINFSSDTSKSATPFYQHLESDSSEYEDNSQSKNKSQIFYDSLQAKTSRNWFTKELHDLVIRKSLYRNLKSCEKSENLYKFFKGRVIRDIKIFKLDVFGPSFNDSLWSTDSWLVTTGNKLHLNSSDASIFQNLLFKKGDILDPDLLADNERILRNLPNINDARIDVFPDFLSPDSVDVTVITKDIWSVKINARMNNKDDYSMMIEDVNFGGTGNRFQSKITAYSNRKNSIGQSHNFTIENIGGSFIKGRTLFEKNYKNKVLSINLIRRFISPKINYGGGLEISNCENYYDTTATIIHDKFNNQDFWLGRAFEVKKRGKYKKRSRFVISGRIFNLNYSKSPPSENKKTSKYYDRTGFVSSFTYSKRNYYRSSMIYSYGKTEDIPTGYKYILTSGLEKNVFFDRFYLGLEYAKGAIFQKAGYLYSKIGAGSFFYNKNFEQSVLSFKGKYFSPLFRSHSYAFRHFIDLNYIIGFDRLEEEFVTINAPYGIRGFNSENAYGTQKLTVNLETVTFTPLFFYGFKFALFSFADTGIIGKNNKSIFSGKLYSGLGLGLRIKNDNMIFRTFQFSFTYYPYAPDDLSSYLSKFQSGQTLRLDDFEPVKPNIIKFE